MADPSQDPAAPLDRAYETKLAELKEAYRQASGWRQRFKIRYRIRMLRKRYLSRRSAY